MIVTSDNYTTFVSYNQADRARAEWIAWEHEAHDHKAIIQAWDFTGSFILEMHKAAASSDKMIAVLSKNYLDAEYNHPEWAAAFVKDPTSGHAILGLYRAKNREPVRRVATIPVLAVAARSTSAAMEGRRPGIRPGTPPVITPLRA